LSLLLLDTHLIVWAVVDDPRLPAPVRDAIDDPAQDLAFSVASIWELAIKASLRKSGFDVDPRQVRRVLLAAGVRELEITAEHAVAVADLPLIHGDPFDRLLLAQAEVEGMTLLTADRLLARYPGPVRFVG
jgi:PIN domain nuclease of toxin-antitoxin system